MLVGLVILFNLLPGADALTCPPNSDAESTIKRMNERFDDFQRKRLERERREERLAKGIDEVKSWRQERARRLQLAQEKYRRPVRDEALERRLESEWEAQQKERARRLDLARQCYVQQLQQKEEWEKRGRAIPGHEEFDLDID